MILGTDVQVDEVEVRFTDVRLATPLKLATAIIEAVTRADVRCRVNRPDGTCAVGVGSATLSPLWAWGKRCPPVAVADALMRDTLVAVGTAITGGGHADPFEQADRMQSEVTPTLDRLRRAAGLEPVPALVGDVCAAAIDAAVHDGWGRASGASSYDLYVAGQVHGDLAAAFGPAMRGRTVAGAVRERPRSRLPVSWLVGAGDDPVSTGSELGRQCAQWIKVKIRCEDPMADARWLAALHSSATGELARHGHHPDSLRLCLDPNEAVRDPTVLADLLDLIGSNYPATRASIAYVEQPFPRTHHPSPVELRALAVRVPLILDEGVHDLRQLERLMSEGWSGVAVKTCRGHSQAIRLAAWAFHTGRVLAVQDLTNTGTALLHSAYLAQSVRSTFGGFECNSLQLAPVANTSLRDLHPGLLKPHAGTVLPGTRSGLGLY